MRSIEAAVDGVVLSLMEEGSIPGLSLAIAREGTLLMAQGYGFANLDHRVPATEHTVYRIASSTKTFTAAAVMLLAEEGKAYLDDPVKHYLPYLPQSWCAITLRHLLTHTSGLANYERFLPDDWQPDDNYEKVVRWVSKSPLESQPGDEWRYSNTNYVVLGVLIERISGTPYRDFVQERILAPLGMTDTRWDGTKEVVPNRAQGYAWDSETLASTGQPPLRNKEKRTAVWDYADGGLLSTVIDLAKWDAALYTDRILKEWTRDQMWTPARLNSGNAVEYGLGWIIKVVEGRRTIGHWGRNPGFMADLSRFVDDGLSVIVLCNRWKADIPRLTKRIANLLIPSVTNDETV